MVYAQMLQNFERTRAAVGSSISKASTICDEEYQLALTEDNFLAIQWKMDRIDQKLTDLYRNCKQNTGVLQHLRTVRRKRESINPIWKNISPNIESSIK